MSTWSEEHDNLLRTLHAEGLSFSQISNRLWREMKAQFSRNACIGRAARLGLAKRGAPKAQRSGVFAPTRQHDTKTNRAGWQAQAAKSRLVVGGNNSVISVPAPPPPRPYASKPDRMEPTATLLTLGAHMCKWPIGDPAHPKFGFCGRQAEASYCEAHRTLAFQPPSAKRAHTEKELVRSLRRYL